MATTLGREIKKREHNIAGTIKMRSFTARNKLNCILLKTESICKKFSSKLKSET